MAFPLVVALYAVPSLQCSEEVSFEIQSLNVIVSAIIQ